MPPAKAEETSRVDLIVGGLEYLAQGFSIFDSELRLVACNRRFLELLGFPEEMGSIGRPLADLFRFNAERGDYGAGDIEELVKERIALARKAEAHCFERVRPNGTVLEVRGTPLPNGGFVTTYSDVTERKTWEDSLQAAKQKAEAANQAKSAFLNMVTHDLRTPLTSIRSFAEILSDNAGIDAEQRQEFLGIINSECLRLVRMLNDLLDFAKIEAGRMDWSIEELDGAELLQSAATSMTPMFAEKQVALELTLPAQAAPRIAGDRDRLTQVIINLLSNAWKFAPANSGHVRVRLDCLASEARISVADNGPGIPAEKHEEVFEEFRQVVGANTTHPAGTGLGLAICRRIVDHLGGRIWVESAPPDGATFSFTVPYSR
ncbi:MAG: Non-motile and phage-resistance protein [Candidatus Accumulibacter appositus]|uniref:histidine kinase n=1 Tax=Candidatus Accumulibacter appositus TaxID=1454003 RepID=A0A011P5Y9_9PROT|nr:PAS-domain containing protein [Accumulibacter sp.]EXI82966.1 MAG: Non-motile and phage-resistance protein [Candidatus Accumulibacter appositus]HRF04527.1 PAS-domain containing protein [Accumulibacter sp.]